MLLQAAKVAYSTYLAVMRNCILIVFTLSLLPLWGNGDPLPSGARQAGMANAAVSLTGLWSVYHNQAGLAALDSLTVGIFYQQHFLARELAQQSIAVASPLGNGVIAVNLNRFGYDLFSQNLVGVAYAMEFGESLRAGVQLDYVGVQLGEGYGNSAGVTAEFGVQARLTDKLWFGVHVFNPNRMEIGGPFEERTPTRFRAGGHYTFSDQFLISAEVAKDIDFQEQVRVGIEYRPSNVLFIRGGLSTDPTSNSLGFGLQLNRLAIDLAASFRSQLGTTPQFGLRYSL